MTKRLYVANLSFDTSEDALTAAFEQDGRKVDSVSIVTERGTGRPRGFAFVEMGSEADGSAAIQDGQELDGRTLTVNETRERPQRGRGGGGGGRRSGW